jgi:hypothetical protein
LDACEHHGTRRADRLDESRIVSGRVLGVDDTSVRLQDPALPGKMRTPRFCLYRGREDHPNRVA